MFHPPVEAFGLRSLRERGFPNASGGPRLDLLFPQGTQAEGFHRRMEHPRRLAFLRLAPRLFRQTCHHQTLLPAVRKLAPVR